MTRYPRSRKLASAVVVLGMLGVVLGFVFSLVGLTTPLLRLSLFAPSLSIFVASIAFSLFGCLALAFFDIADAIAGGRPGGA